MDSEKKNNERVFFAGLLTKQKGKKRWQWFGIGVVLFLAWICFMLGGQIACESGGGILLEDFRCVNTSNLDLCKLPDGRMMVYDLGMPEDAFNLSLNLS